MGDENEQVKLAQRSNPWFFSKVFQTIFNVLEEAKMNMPVSEAFSPATVPRLVERRKHSSQLALSEFNQSDSNENM